MAITAVSSLFFHFHCCCCFALHFLSAPLCRRTLFLALLLREFARSRALLRLWGEQWAGSLMIRRGLLAFNCFKTLFYAFFCNVNVLYDSCRANANNRYRSL